MIRVLLRSQHARWGAVALLALCTPAGLSGQDVTRGKDLYDKWCAECHGESGAGDGSAASYMLPRPRDFTRALYQIRTTASGELPTDDDIRRVIDDGMPGTAMPAWKTRLSSSERDDLVEYLKGLSTFFSGPAPTAISLGRAPRASEEGLVEGRAIFEQLECFKCHGDQGRGDGQSAPTLTDDWDFPIFAADLTQNWQFNGGGSVEQIYTRMRTGLDGTPMPSNSDVVDAGIITDEQLWRVAHYVRSLSPGEAPRVREVIRAFRTDGALPAGPDDGIWAGIEPFYIPLVGQIIVAPRWFAPAVSAIWVRAVHDGARISLLLSWSDRSASPDPEWDEWLTRLAGSMTDVDGMIPVEQGPDRFIVQLPSDFDPDDAELPFFLGGGSRRPVHLWRWTSTPNQLEVGLGAGLGTFEPGAGENEVSHSARYADGEWRLQVTRSLVASDTATSPTFHEGASIPIAFFAADGSNGEGDVRGSVSAWYSIYLDAPTLPRVYFAPVVAVLLTAALGLVVVWRAQRRERAE